MLRNRLTINVIALCSCLAMTMLGCDSSNDKPATGASSSTGQTVAPQAADQPASLLDVLHLTDYAYFVYTGTNYGNAVDFGFICEGITWDGCNFSADHEGPYEPRVGLTYQRHIKLEGRVSEDGKLIETMTASIETRPQSGSRVDTEQFTWKNVPVGSSYEKPGSGWRDNPYMTYKVTVPRAEVATHVQGWASTYQDGDSEPSLMDQEARIHLVLPAEDAALTVSISFSRK